MKVTSSCLLILFKSLSHVCLNCRPLVDSWCILLEVIFSIISSLGHSRNKKVLDHLYVVSAFDSAFKKYGPKTRVAEIAQFDLFSFFAGRSPVLCCPYNRTIFFKCRHNVLNNFFSWDGFVLVSGLLLVGLSCLSHFCSIFWPKIRIFEDHMIFFSVVFF